MDDGQHRAATKIAETLKGDADIHKVSLYKGQRMSMVYCYIETETDFTRLRVEVYED